MIFQNFLKRAGDVALSGPYNQMAINDRGEEATWQCEEHLIMGEISSVDLHLSGGGYVVRSGSPDAI